MVTGEYPHLNCIQIVWLTDQIIHSFGENETKINLARLILGNRAKTSPASGAGRFGFFGPGIEVGFINMGENKFRCY